MTDPEGTIYPGADSSPLIEPIGSSPGTSTTGANRSLPADTRRAAWDHLAPTGRGRTRPGSRATDGFRSQPARSMARSRVPQLGFRRRRARPSGHDRAIRSVRMPYSRRRSCSKHPPGSVAVARLSCRTFSRSRLSACMGSSTARSSHRCCGSSPTSFPCSTHRTAPGSSSAATSTFRARRPTPYPRTARGGARRDPIAGPRRGQDAGREPPPSTKDARAGSGDACGHVATWGSLELDHLFVPPSLAPEVRTVRVDRSAVEARPVRPRSARLDLALSAERTPQLGTRRHSPRRSGAVTVGAHAMSSRSWSTGPTRRSAI